MSVYVTENARELEWIEMDGQSVSGGAEGKSSREENRRAEWKKASLVCAIGDSVPPEGQ